MRLSQLLEEAANRLDSLMEIWNVELLVEGVEIVVGEAEAHHHAGNFQHVREVGDDGDGAAAGDAAVQRNMLFPMSLPLDPRRLPR